MDVFHPFPDTVMDIATDKETGQDIVRTFRKDGQKDADLVVRKKNNSFIPPTLLISVSFLLLPFAFFSSFLFSCSPILSSLSLLYCLSTLRRI